MGMAGNENSTFPISQPQVVDHTGTVNGLLFCSNLSQTVRLGFTLDVHETLLALTLHVFFQDLMNFYSAA